MHENFSSHLGELGFCVRPYRSKRLAPYFANMSKDNTTVVFDDNVADVLRSQGYSAAEAPRSIYKVEKLFEALSAYAPGTIPRPNRDAAYHHGVSLARACFARKDFEEYLSVLPFTAETICRITSNPSGSAGLTAYGSTKAEAQTRALERGLQTLQRVKQPEACLAFKRTQFNEKTRLVWGYPYSMTAIEGLVAYPLLEMFKKGTTPMAFSKTSLALGSEMVVASYHFQWAYCLDFSQFDATVPGDLIRQAFDILRTWFRMDDVEPVSGKTVKDIFTIIERYFIHTPIVMPDGHLYLGKDHGVPSGSYFTQIVDSIVNTIVAGAISYQFGMNVDKEALFVLGDDLLLWSNRKVDLDRVSSYVNAAFHMRLHGSEKSERVRFNETIHFLGRDWTKGIPNLSQDEILKRMVFPEKFRHRSVDPDERDREVRIMILTYASVYRGAWGIAARCLGGCRRNIDCGFANVDVNTYIHNSRAVQVNPEHLSGFERYKRKYHSRWSRGMPITGTHALL